MNRNINTNPIKIMANQSNTKNQAFSQTKFALYDYTGKVKNYYLVDQKPLTNPAPNKNQKQIAHSIIVIDRSGSMYYDLKMLKEYLLKLLTLDEYLNSDLVITLISYSSLGNVKCHFQRIPISQIMAHNSPYQEEIKNIQVSGCTCISQSLEIAKSLVTEFSDQENQADELTAITLHTDGFANDPNYISECHKIDKIVKELNKYNVIINSISYSKNGDYKLLSKIANSASGKCIQADNVKQIYDSLYQTNKLLNSLVLPPFNEELETEYDYQVLVSQTARKIIGSNQTLNIRGLKPTDKSIVYKYRQISKQEYQQLSKIPVKQTDESVFAFIKANLAQGNLNLAKYALVSTFDDTLIQNHQKALTNSQIMEFTQDIEKTIFNPDLLKNHRILDKIKVSKKINILELLNILEEHKNYLIINFKHLRKNYQRTGLKKVEGKRDDEQNLIQPWLKTVEIDRGDYVPMGKFKINHNTATINMLINRQVKLVSRDNNKQVSEVAGVLLNGLTRYNNYTLISDGEVNLHSLRIKISNQKTFELLKAKKVLTRENKIPQEFDFTCEYDLKLSDLPLISQQKNYGNLDQTFDKLLKLQVLNSIIGAHIKQESELYSTKQLQELRKHYLSKDLYLNFPTTNEYQNLEEALNKGTVDTRVRYKIELGNTEILNLSKLHSANKFLDRLYEGYDVENKEYLEKPTFDLTLDKPITFSHKTLSKRIQITAVDELMKTIFDDFLGLTDNQSVSNILRSIDAYSLIHLLEARKAGKTINKEEFVVTLTQTKELINNHIKQIYHQEISPLVFYIGTTGLIPDELDSQGFTAEEISQKFPQLKISKSEKEGTFFLIGNTIITIYPQMVYYTTQS